MSGTCYCSARNSSRINAKSFSREHPTPVDDAALVAGATEGVVSPDHVPLRVGRDLPVSNDFVKRVLANWVAVREWVPRAGRPRRDFPLDMKGKTKQTARESKQNKQRGKAKQNKAARESKASKSNKRREQTQLMIKTSKNQPKKGKEKQNKAARHKIKKKQTAFANGQKQRGQLDACPVHASEGVAPSSLLTPFKP